MTQTPASRTLVAVLRRGQPTEPVRLMVGEFGAADPSNGYCNVILQGTAVRIPMLAGVADTTGRPAYVLATKDFLICIGTVTP